MTRAVKHVPVTMVDGSKREFPVLWACRLGDTVRAVLLATDDGQTLTVQVDQAIWADCPTRPLEDLA